MICFRSRVDIGLEGASSLLPVNIDLISRHSDHIVQVVPIHINDAYSRTLKIYSLNTKGHHLFNGFIFNEFENKALICPVIIERDVVSLSGLYLNGKDGQVSRATVIISAQTAEVTAFSGIDMHSGIYPLVLFQISGYREGQILHRSVSVPYAMISIIPSRGTYWRWNFRAVHRWDQVIPCIDHGC